MDDVMQCRVCGKFFNKAILSEVFEHEHKHIDTDKEHFGSKLKDDKESK